MEICLEDFKKCCRCCLARVDAMQPLFGASLNDMLKKLMNLQIMQNDGYPQQMCSRCVLKLSSAYTFYIMVLKSHKTLEEILKTSEDNGGLSLEHSCEKKKELNMYEKEKEALDNVIGNQEFNSPPEKNTLKQNTLRTMISKLSESESSEGLSDKEEDYHCSQCEHTSKNQEAFQIHLQTHLVGSRNISKGEADTCAQLCSICGARFRWRTSLHKHLRQHRGGRYKCGICLQVFAEASTLNVHIVRHSTNQKPFECSTCGRSFTQQSSLRKHAQTHDARAQLKCDECGKSFLHKQSLLRHRESSHSPNECSVCRKIFSGKKLLDAHMKLHTKKINSSNMEILTDNMTSESINIQTVTVEFLCLICTQKFQSRESLEVHICAGSKII